MKMSFSRWIGLTLIIFVLSGVAPAQNSTLRAVAGDKWLISAKAGGVNHVEGDVNVVRKKGKSGRLLKGDTVEVGDTVRTGEGGRAEILLNPGSYLRLNGNSSFQFKTTDLEDLQVRVEAGSVILEVFATNDFRVSVQSPREDYGLIDSGVYRIDVGADGSGRLEVWKGKAEVDGTVLKGGRAAVTIETQASIAKFDRDERDDFETWSKDRAKELAKSTNDLRDRSLRNSLMTSFMGGRWNMYDSFGLWVFNPRLGRFCFLPFGYGWSSPYGYGFGSDIWWYRLPQVVYTAPPRVYPNTQPPAGDGSVGRVPPDRKPIERPAGQIVKRPPFAAVQGAGSATGRDFSRSGGVVRETESGGAAPAPRFEPRPRSDSPAPAPRIAPSGAPGPSREAGPRKVPQ